ncbi:MAG: hypothetical protein KGL95_05110, partial [Patescibacteria group bacterium]|nr:hypothetical protein [Patescibacteria group bacterium]
IYQHSTYIQKLIRFYNSHKPLRIAFLDIDFTLSSNYLILPSLKEKLYSMGFVIAFVTSRTEEMVMSLEEYTLSHKYGFNRPRPMMHMENKKYSYVDPRIVNPYLVDPDMIIGSTGTQILLRQSTGGFAPDLSFDEKFKGGILWKRNMLRRIQHLEKEGLLFSVSMMEDMRNYYQKKTNVFPPTYRIQVAFATEKDKFIFCDRLKKRNIFGSLLFRNSRPEFRIIDDSNISIGRHVIFITPRGSGKKLAVRYTVNKTVQALRKFADKEIKQFDIETLLAGDGMQDLPMLFDGAEETDSISILVGGSKIAQELSEISPDSFSGEVIKNIHERLRPITPRGYYLYPYHMKEEKKIVYKKFIIGSDAFPTTHGPETILAYLNLEELQ